MSELVQLILPEVILATVACVLILMGVSLKSSMRRVAAGLALLALVVVFAMLIGREPVGTNAAADPAGAVRIHEFGHFIKLLAAGIGILLVLVAWPTRSDGTGNAAMNFGQESGEFFGLMLLSLSGVFLVASANDMILLFLGLELASLPAYIMVSISRPIPVAQEAGVKYFFLGAMSAAIMLFGFSYLYGTTGTTDLHIIAGQLRATVGGLDGATKLSAWQMLAVVMLVAGFAFKLAAVPLHFYAGDVYQGAATPVTAFLAFVPKTSGMVALIKILYVIGGGAYANRVFNVPHEVVRLMWALAALTMTAGNVLALVQPSNVKRVLAYSSVAHSGYMLVGITALVGGQNDPNVQDSALKGVLFYLAAYGIMNTAAFGVLTLLPSRENAPATSAETFDDLAGQGRTHVALGLAMAVSCFSLIGIPLTVGFFGKLQLIQPALGAKMYWLVIITVVNAAISAAYYLRIVAAMFLRTAPRPLDDSMPSGAPEIAVERGFMLPIALAVGLSVAGTLLFGTVLPATEVLATRVNQAVAIDDPILLPETKTAAQSDDAAAPAIAAAARDKR